MIEILFSDSACGGLKMAQECCILLGDNSDIFGFNLDYSVGEISENRPDAQRLKVLERRYGIFPFDGVHQMALELIQMAKENLKTICDRAAAGESLRIWYSNQPDELCGLYWFLAQLNQLDRNYGQIYLVKLPEWDVDGNGNIIRMIGWGEVAPGEWYKYIDMQKPVSPIFCRSCAAHWQALQAENAPLRAVLNGRLVSVPENIYDDFIIREIATEDEKFQEVMIVGRVLGKYQLGISDFWVAFRIEEMICAGKLEAVSAAPKDMPTYHRILRKCVHTAV